MNDILSFACVIDNFLADKTTRNNVLVLGNLSTIYLSLGIPNFKLVIMLGMLRTIVTKHDLVTNIPKQLTVLLERFAIISQSATGLDALVAMISAKDRMRNAVIAIVHSNRQQQYNINQIANAYDKHHFPWCIAQSVKGQLLYVDKGKSLYWSQSGQIQLLKEMITTRHSQTISNNMYKIKNFNRTKTLLVLKKKGSDHENQ